MTDFKIRRCIDWSNLEGLFRGLLSRHHAEAAVRTLLDDLIHDDLHELGELLAQLVLRRRRALEFKVARQSLGARGRGGHAVTVMFPRGLRRIVVRL
jgi:hypothetical protein